MSMQSTTPTFTVLQWKVIVLALAMLEFQTKAQDTKREAKRIAAAIVEFLDDMGEVK